MGINLVVYPFGQIRSVQMDFKRLTLNVVAAVLVRSDFGFQSGIQFLGIIGVLAARRLTVAHADFHDDLDGTA